MTSSSENIFRVTGPLRGESTDPLSKACFHEIYKEETNVCFFFKNDTVHLADLIITHQHIKNLISPIDFPCEDFCHMFTNGL